MSKVILQPTSNKGAQEHFEDTITNSVRIELIKEYIKDNETVLEIEKYYPNGEVFIWGVTNGKNNVNKKKWDKILKGDVTLFSKRGGIFAKAVTTVKFNNVELAKRLWGVDKDNNTWENIYLVQEINIIDIPYNRFNKIVEYNEKFVIQRFQVLDDEKSNRLFATLDLFSDEYTDNVSYIDYQSILESLDNEEGLDAELNVKRRKEQSFLRDYLFKNKKTAICGICGEEFPIDMLVAAHIKKRSLCTKEEKLDYKNIVMPMCKLGCDDLYEKGYVYVDMNGNLSINNKKQMTEIIENYLNKITDKKCKYYSNENSKYFEANIKRHRIEGK